MSKEVHMHTYAGWGAISGRVGKNKKESRSMMATQSKRRKTWNWFHLGQLLKHATWKTCLLANPSLTPKRLVDVKKSLPASNAEWPPCGKLHRHYSSKSPSIPQFVDIINVAFPLLNTVGMYSAKQSSRLLRPPHSSQPRMMAWWQQQSPFI